jgi:replicative DNA helicase
MAMKLTEMKNLQAEENVLGEILKHPKSLHKVSAIIKAEDFSRTEYQLIYSAMADMVLRDEPLDIVTLAERLRADGQLEKIGIRAITNLGMAGGMVDVEAQAKIIADHAHRRRLVEEGIRLQEEAGDYSLAPQKIAFDFSTRISGMTDEAEDNTKSAKEGALELSALIDKRTDRGADVLNTGLVDVDRRLMGFEEGQLIVIAGRPAHGKSAFAGTIVVNLAQRGKRVLMFSMEMNREEVMGRFVSRIANIDGYFLKKPNEMDEEMWSRYLVGLDKASKLPIDINQQGSLTPADVASVANQEMAKGKLDLIVIDYLQLMSSGRHETSRVQEISYITRTLKNLAVSLKVPIILLSQLSRSNEKENRAPKVTDLRDSGSIEQDANTIILLHRESHLSPDMKTVEYSNSTTVDVAKQRDGECGSCLVTFVPSRTYFANYVEEANYA